MYGVNDYLCKIFMLLSDFIGNDKVIFRRFFKCLFGFLYIYILKWYLWERGSIVYFSDCVKLRYRFVGGEVFVVVDFM